MFGLGESAPHSVGHSGRKGGAFMGDESPGGGITSELTEQSMKSAYMMQGMGIAHGTKVKDGRITIGGLDPFHFIGHGIQGFLPGNPGKLAGASRPSSFNRV
jgi:hypothetical protein